VNFYSLLAYIKHNGDESPKDSVWIGSIWLRKRTSSALLRTQYCVFEFYKMAELSRVPVEMFCSRRSTLLHGIALLVS